MQRRTYLATTLALCARVALPAGVVGLAGCTGSAWPRGVAGFDGDTMGTRYSVRLGARPDSAKLDDLQRQVEAELEAVEAAMSTYRPESELSRFNASLDPGWYRLSSATWRVVSQAQRASALSGGAFDGTVGPLVDLWGFGPSGSTHAVPEKAAIRRMLDRVGFEHIAVRAAESSIRKERAEASLDLSGIAKGHAVDQVAALLEAAGINDYLVEIGGELRARGIKPDGQTWSVGVERPAPGQRRVQRVVDLKGQAIATSGDYRNYFERDGRRFSHAINPRTGMPIDHQLTSVSVIAPTTMEADAMSTTLMVLGPEQGQEFAQRHGLAAHFMLRSPGGIVEIATDEFQRHVVS